MAKRKARPHKSAPQKHAAAANKRYSKTVFVARLERASIIYLALPLLIFLLGFLNWGWMIVCTASLCAALWFCFKNAAVNNAPESVLLPPPPPRGGGDALISRGQIIFCFAAALFVCLWIGPGGWGEQSYDWDKHNPMLWHLATQPWPVLLELEGDNLFLVYYIAYYLPAGLIGKLTGSLTAADHALLLWTACGVLLALLWLYAFARGAGKWILALFFLFSGLDLVGVFAIGAENHSPHILFFGHTSIDAWAVHLWEYEFNSNLQALSWVPQQAVPGWIITGLLLRALAAGLLPRRAAFFVALAPLWSIFAAFALVIFFALEWLWEAARKNFQVREYFSPECLCVLPILPVLAFYFLSASGAGTLDLIDMDPKYIAGRSLVFALEFGLLWALLFAAHLIMRRQGASWLSGDLYKVFVLMLLCLFLVSAFADKNPQRGTTILWLFMLMIAAIRMLETCLPMQKPAALKAVTVAVILVLMLGAWSPLIRMNSAFSAVYQRGGLGSLYRPPPRYSLLDIGWLVDMRIRSHHYARPLDDPFYQYFARKP